MQVQKVYSNPRKRSRAIKEDEEEEPNVISDNSEAEEIIVATPITCQIPQFILTQVVHYFIPNPSTTILGFVGGFILDDSDIRIRHFMPWNNYSWQTKQQNYLETLLHYFSSRNSQLIGYVKTKSKNETQINFSSVLQIHLEIICSEKKERNSYGLQFEYFFKGKPVHAKVVDFPLLQENFQSLSFQNLEFILQEAREIYVDFSAKQNAISDKLILYSDYQSFLTHFWTDTLFYNNRLLQINLIEITKQNEFLKRQVYDRAAQLFTSEDMERISEDELIDMLQNRISLDVEEESMEIVFECNAKKEEKKDTTKKETKPTTTSAKNTAAFNRVKNEKSTRNTARKNQTTLNTKPIQKYIAQKPITVEDTEAEDPYNFDDELDAMQSNLSKPSPSSSASSSSAASTTNSAKGSKSINSTSPPRPSSSTSTNTVSKTAIPTTQQPYKVGDFVCFCKNKVTYLLKIENITGDDIIGYIFVKPKSLSKQQLHYLESDFSEEAEILPSNKKACIKKEAILHKITVLNYVGYLQEKFEKEVPDTSSLFYISDEHAGLIYNADNQTIDFK